MRQLSQHRQHRDKRCAPFFPAAAEKRGLGAGRAPVFTQRKEVFFTAPIVLLGEQRAIRLHHARRTTDLQYAFQVPFAQPGACFVYPEARIRQGEDRSIHGKDGIAPLDFY